MKTEAVAVANNKASANEQRVVAKLTKTSSQKTAICMHLCALFGSLVLLFSVGSSWHLCRKLMIASSMQFSEIIDINYKSTYTGMEVGAIKSFYDVLLRLSSFSIVLVCWIAMPFIIKQKREVLRILKKYIEESGVNAQHPLAEEEVNISEEHTG